MLEGQVGYALIGARDLMNLDVTASARKVDRQAPALFRAGQSAEDTVGRRNDSGLPTGIGQRFGQVANDVADSPDLAVGQRAILRREQEYSLAVDRFSPVLPSEVQILP
jgi:hypothetical protein